MSDLTTAKHWEDLIGKPLSKVVVNETWDGSEVAEIILTFEGGARIEINAASLRGCRECDPDGSQIDYLSLWRNDL